MENAKQNEGSLQQISADEATGVSGGDGAQSCVATATAGTGGVNVSNPAPTPGDALIGIYEGFVDVTSHIIERLANVAM
ncbi:MAG: hypothetical protein ACXWBL_07830 [Usitatibacter sp.]